MSDLYNQDQPPAKKISLGNRADNELANAILLEEATPPAYLRTTIKLVGYTILIFLLWAAIARLDVVAVAPGQIMPIQSVKIIQHVDGGRIATIDVTDGQEVREGEVLMRLNETEPTAEYQTLSARYWGLYTRVERLRALLEDRKADFSAVPETYKQIVVENELTLKTQREQLSQFDAEIKILAEVSSIRTDLAKEKLATKVQALSDQRNLSNARAEMLTYRRQAQDELNTAANDLAQTKEQMDKMHDRLQRVEVRAPVDGVVQDLRYRTIGGVVDPGAVLMNVVPIDGRMHAEVRVLPTDVGFVKKGEAVRVKIGTYDFVRYGTLDGTVSVVSAFNSLDERQNPYFKVIITLDRNYVGEDRTKTIEPGMTVQADIVTDSQSVLSYLLRPIFVAFKQGMRER